MSAVQEIQHEEVHVWRDTAQGKAEYCIYLDTPHAVLYFHYR